MRVLVVGGYGLIGGYVVSALALDGHEVIGTGRNACAAVRKFPRLLWRHADLAHFTLEQWSPLLDGVEVVVNCAGALQDSARDDLQAVHVTGLVTLAKAAHTAGVRRLIHISAAGMEGAPGAFGRTKLAAEAALRSQVIDWTILRPGLVLAPAAFGGSALLRGLAGFPLVIPAVHPESLIQLAGVDDVTKAVQLAIMPNAPSRVATDLVSTEAYPLKDILMQLRAWLGFQPAPVLSLPAAMAGISGKAADALAWLGWRSPMRSTAIAQLRHGVRGDPTDAAVLPGLRVHSLESLLSAYTAGVQERWFARLYFVKPLALANLSLFWLVSGVLGLVRFSAAALVLTGAGLPRFVADACVFAGSSLDILVALMVCHRRSAPLALKGMIAVSCAYMLGATLWRPDLWTDPLGPMLKVFPLIVLTLAVLAVMEER